MEKYAPKEYCENHKAEFVEILRINEKLNEKSYRNATKIGMLKAKRATNVPSSA